GAAGIINGSHITAAAAVITIGVLLLFGYRELHAPARTKRRALIVHSLTVAILLFAIVIFRSARVDSVFLVILLGVFNRYLLRNGHRDDLTVLGASTVLMAAAPTVTPGLPFALLMLTFLPLITWALYSSMLMRLGERSAGGMHGGIHARLVPAGFARM